MKTYYVLFAALALTACASPSPRVAEETPASEDIDVGILWTEYSAEYQAVSAQVYAVARRDLPRLLADPNWSALPGDHDVAGKPPAIILDVDETVVSNADYQETLRFAPYSRYGHFDWMRRNKAIPIRGAVETIEFARAAGVEVFFLTNRACEAFEDAEGECPYEQVTIDDLREAGIETDAEHVLMAWEQPGWNKEKLNRREYLAETYRVIMLFGDDYGDFVHCTRSKPLPPCTEAATRESRHAALDTYADYWGNGWYILPNPMHGSWTTVR
jgi:5'-nucleotidase (lipoprotein e(P4) family)